MSYDYNKRVPVWGFGGCPNQGEPVSHCFSLNEDNSEALGVEGILNTYR